ncbi:hypothetical protein P691DRAFT_673485 [Macrolepiota fuliginosa MF-IS2]|uniref:Uncharacterized protein n=1 Tax=Macrolepiota fuliginosa MF-IS2 TaxID=1400762 RepID=A0A9P5X7Y3_9AGAR|nr:hypothetical protein P691DRAFT_673485 [Macrolepiota fuliginosa MF-IS2]
MHSTVFYTPILSAAQAIDSRCSTSSSASDSCNNTSSPSGPSNTNHSAPQCCHCGWRGSHSPTCPFR